MMKLVAWYTRLFTGSHFPKKGEGNPGHYKPFSAMYGAQGPTEEDIPSNINNVRKVSEQERVANYRLSKLQNLDPDPPSKWEKLRLSRCTT